MDEAARFRIGELSYRVGVSPDVLRAWEKRYGLLRPSRSEGGYRLYTAHDEWRVRLMQQKLWTGLSAAQAAQEVARMEPEGNLSEDSIETPLRLAQQLCASLRRRPSEEDRCLFVVGAGGRGFESRRSR
jgi:DNA-binding transcriptional MerR regulator